MRVYPNVVQALIDCNFDEEAKKFATFEGDATIETATFFVHDEVENLFYFADLDCCTKYAEERSPDGIFARPCEPTNMPAPLLKRVQGEFLDRLYKYRNMGLPMHSNNVSIIAEELGLGEEFEWSELDLIAEHCGATVWQNS